jgi:bifunctional non-homologous end joining protein LigD
LSLRKYHAKRHFNRSPEPRGAGHAGQGPLRFVVQKHEASHLHYDFRLELGGALKSWAIPKGPSLNPLDKRLAMMVEDHPLEYAKFEGIIPEGNYGAGTVMIWDEGAFHAAGAADRQESERLLTEGLRKGHLSFVLEGKKLKGQFSLLKLKRGEPNAWLLIKKQDAFATADDIRAADRSVASRRTMEGIAGRSRKAGAVWRSNRGRRAADLTDAPAAEMPRNIRPMLATAVEESFDRPGWVFEIKWDGYRAIAEVDAKKVRLYSRKHLSFEGTYAPVVESLQQLGHEAVLDGEIVVLDQTGKAQFQLLQNYQSSKKGVLVYYVFDLLYLDGHDLRELPLLHRKKVLAEILPSLPHIRVSEHVEERGAAFFAAVAERGLEGIVAKDGASHYQEGRRSKSWLKIKTHLRQAAVIGGFTDPRGSRQGLGSLLLGVYEHKDLVYIGHAGSGFTEKSLAQIRRRLEPLIREKTPFHKRPKANAPVHWVKPELVCEVSFSGWSNDLHMRHPVFQGLRDDTPAAGVHREVVGKSSK